MIGSALAITAEQVIEYSVNGRIVERTGNGDPRMLLQGIYGTKDGADSVGGRWVAISVESQEQLTALGTLLARGTEGLPDGLRAIELDEAVTGWCLERSRDEIVGVLAGHGIPVAPVLLPHEITDVEQLTERRFIESVEHPIAGRVPISRFPAVFAAGPRTMHRHRPPLVGEHSREILSRVLGLSPAEIDRLAVDGVIGGYGEAASPPPPPHARLP
jgi:crotonobetainyl-CoA:carnitine CoA-transferase CaiB-like acyl-CoA transferase